MKTIFEAANQVDFKKIGINEGQGFNEWFETFIEEKGDKINHDFEINVKGEWHQIPLEALKGFIFIMPSTIQNKIKDTLVKLDYKNADINDYLKHLATGIVKSTFGKEG